MRPILRTADRLAHRLRLIETPTDPRRGKGIDPGWSVVAWAAWLLEYDRDEYGDPPEPVPATTTRREAHVQLLQERARRAEALFVAGVVVRMEPEGLQPIDGGKWFVRLSVEGSHRIEDEPQLRRRPARPVTGCEGPERPAGRSRRCRRNLGQLCPTRLGRYPGRP
jgi:hypothetical protein